MIKMVVVQLQPWSPGIHLVPNRHSELTDPQQKFPFSERNYNT